MHPLGGHLWALEVATSRDRRREAPGGGGLKPTPMLSPVSGVKPNPASLKSDHRGFCALTQ